MKKAATALYQVQEGLGWDRVLRHFILGGDAKALGSDAVHVLLTIQALTDWDTGIASVSIPQLSEYTGIGARSIYKILGVLKAAEHIVPLQIPAGKRSQFKVRHWILATNQDRQVPIAWDYAVNHEKARASDIESFLSGGAAPAEVHIHIHQQVQIVNGGVGIQIAESDADSARSWWSKQHPSKWSEILSAASLSTVGPFDDARVIAAWRHHVGQK